MKKEVKEKGTRKVCWGSFFYFLPFSISKNLGGDEMKR
jgi:hypothetical protein